MADPFRFTTLAHGRHRVCNPISDAALDRVIALLDLPEEAHVLDLCCGKAAMLARILRAYPTATGVGVDLNPAFLADAADHDLGHRLTLVEQDAWAYPRAGRRWDLVCHVGAALENGDRDATLSALAAAAADGGLILFGDGVWRGPPDPDGLSAIGWEPDAVLTHQAHIRAAEAHGLTLLYTATASLQDFDHYEGLYLAAMERWLREHPGDPEATAFRERIHRVRDSYFAFRRAAIGFALYLFVVDRGPAAE